MTHEVANRLQQLRKQKGLSQEELADKLGISRQAVSKWERAEASPDTDNLILLARLYGISIDELLNTEETNEEIKSAQNDQQEEKQETQEEFFEEKKDRVHIGKNGLHIYDEDGDEVHIGLDGIHIIDEDGEQVHIGKDDVYYDEEGHEIKIKQGKHSLYIDKEETKAHKILGIVEGIVSLVFVLAYFVIGGVWGLWHPAWIIYFAIPVFVSLSEAIYKRKTKEFAYPVLVAAIYLLTGFLYGWWHPGWVLFLTIPVYYLIVELIEKILQK